MDTHGKGHTMILKGSVIYIAKCKPEKANFNLDAMTNCTLQIPVIYGNDSKVGYADPITFIVSKYPTTVRNYCSHFLITNLFFTKIFQFSDSM